LNELINFLLEDYELTKKEIAELSSQITVMINIGANIPIIINALRSQLQFSSDAFAEKLTAKMVNVYNNTRQWDLKGYTPKELSKYETKTTNTSLLENENECKVSTITSTKISRNAPCTCGSGKKYKKCCG
jgi:preprotein translocase subunit SecA